MKKVIETIEAELNRLKPYYDEYVKLDGMLIKLKGKPNEPNKRKGRPIQNEIVKVTSVMPELILSRYNLKPDDSYDSRNEFMSYTKIATGTYEAWKQKKWIEVIKL